jgi:DNA invertase Pin-like site-specific DNA recombinase
MSAEGCAKISVKRRAARDPTRRELLKLLKDLTPGDVMAVTRIDRIARSTFDLFAIVKQIVDAGGQFRSLAEPWATRHQHRALKDRCPWRAPTAPLPGRYLEAPLFTMMER